MNQSFFQCHKEFHLKIKVLDYNPQLIFLRIIEFP